MVGQAAPYSSINLTAEQLTRRAGHPALTSDVFCSKMRDARLG